MEVVAAVTQQDRSHFSLEKQTVIFQNYKMKLPTCKRSSIIQITIQINAVVCGIVVTVLTGLYLLNMILCVCTNKIVELVSAVILHTIFITLYGMSTNL